MINSSSSKNAGISSLEINEDIKREIAFYNVTKENVMKGMKILVQA